MNELDVFGPRAVLGGIDEPQAHTEVLGGGHEQKVTRSVVEFS